MNIISVERPNKVIMDEIDGYIVPAAKRHISFSIIRLKQRRSVFGCRMYSITVS